MIEVVKETLASLNRPPATWGLLAEFSTPAAMFTACERVRDAGYTKWDSHSPFPVHGIEKAMALKASPLPIFCFFIGMGAAATAMWFQRWTGTSGYEFVISGKPFFSWPAYVPVTFEVGVLAGALTALIGMLAINQLPRLHHPLFTSERFERFSDDKFFVSIEAKDPRFDVEATRAFLESLHADHVEKVVG